MVREAQQRGHRVTLFNRGRNPNPTVENLVGDRDGQLEALLGKKWDAVIDNSGYVPRHVQDSANLLRDHVHRYLFISTISVYADFRKSGLDETYPLGKLPPEHSGEDVTGATYGPFKVLCESAVRTEFGDRATVIRPGYIVGPGDSTDRWTYWPLRVAAGGPMMVPGSPDDPVQFIDVRDLAHFTLSLLEADAPGTFNAIGPGEPLTMAAMIAALAAGLGTKPNPLWVGNDFLETHKASFPIWAPPAGDYLGLHTVNAEQAKANGLQHRGVADTGRDTVAWWQTLDASRQDKMRTGLRIQDQLAQGPASLAEQLQAEAELLKIWEKSS